MSEHLQLHKKSSSDYNSPNKSIGMLNKKNISPEEHDKKSRLSRDSLLNPQELIQSFQESCLAPMEENLHTIDDDEQEEMEVSPMKEDETEEITFNSENSESFYSPETIPGRNRNAEDINMHVTKELMRLPSQKIELRLQETEIDTSAQNKVVVPYYVTYDINDYKKACQRTIDSYQRMALEDKEQLEELEWFENKHKTSWKHQSTLLPIAFRQEYNSEGLLL